MGTVSKAGLFAAGLIGALLATGCEQQQVREEPQQPQALAPHRTVDTSWPDATLILGTDALVEKVRLSDPRLRRVGNFTQGQVTVQNLTDDTLTLEYRIRWEDGSGFEVSDDPVWHRFTLTPRGMERFTGTGKSADARRIIFTVRAPGDVFIDYYRRNKME